MIKHINAKIWGNKDGFTLVEILFVVFIVGMLVVALMPKLSQTNVNSKIDNVEADLRVFSQDINNYILDYGGVYIEGCADIADSGLLKEATKKLIGDMNGYLGFSLNTNPEEYTNGLNASGEKFCRVITSTNIKLDPWGNSYRVLIDPRNNSVIVASSGPNAEFETDKYSQGEFGDDIIVIVKGK